MPVICGDVTGGAFEGVVTGALEGVVTGPKDNMTSFNYYKNNFCRKVQGKAGTGQKYENEMNREICNLDVICCSFLYISSEGHTKNEIFDLMHNLFVIRLFQGCVLGTGVVTTLVAQLPPLGFVSSFPPPGIRVETFFFGKDLNLTFNVMHKV